MNVPTMLTLLRIVLLVPIVVCIIQRVYCIAMVSFCVAALLDWLDGKLARMLQQQSVLGAMLDHVADKLLVITTLTTLLYRDPTWILLLCVLCVIARDLLMAGLRELWLQTGQVYRAKVRFFGKCKTAVQMVGIASILGLQWLTPQYYQVYIQCILLAIACITILSIASYLHMPKQPSNTK